MKVGIISYYKYNSFINSKKKLNNSEGDTFYDNWQKIWMKFLN